MNNLQYHEKYASKTFVDSTSPSYPTPYHTGFTQTPTPMQSQNQSPQLSDHIQSPIIGIFKINALATTSEATVFPADIVRSQEEEDSDDILSVSTAFHPQLPAADTIFSSSDSVLFCVHSNTIIGACESAFSEFLGSPLEDPKFREAPIPIPSTSDELNIILHMLYGISPASYSPTFDILANAVDRMPAYSITPCKYILPGTPLYNLLLSHAPLHPLEVYALAAHHDIRPLAIMTSSHLLSYPLQTITDSQADRMGAIYLKKLMTLHVDRFNALKGVLLKPPFPHPPTRDCDFSTQKKLTRAWSLVSAQLAWDARPDLSSHLIQAALDPLLIQLDCEGCQKSLRDRIKDLVVRWTAVTVSPGYAFLSSLHQTLIREVLLWGLPLTDAPLRGRSALVMTCADKSSRALISPANWNT